MTSFQTLAAGRDALLPKTALSALIQGDAYAAHAAADRWVRVARPNVDNLLMRAQAAHRLGFPDYARDDIAEALYIGPPNAALYLRLMLWGDPRERAEAARVIVQWGSGEAIVAARTLAALGAGGAGVVRVADGRATGRLGWRPERTAEAQFSGTGRRSVALAPDPAHPWASIFGAATDFRFDLGGEPFLRVALAVDGEDVATARLSPTPGAFADDPTFAGARLTVVVPVYDDLEATRACLETVFGEIAATPDCRLLVVDDDAPNPALKRYLAEAAAGPRSALLVNPGNLGFVGAVNRAFRCIRDGDILLLNADTLLPEGALRRFLDVAKAHPDVGLINPLSNHGEFVNWPTRIRENVHDPATWRAIDAAAARAGPESIVDIPSATGFCSYISRACLDAVGGLSDEFVDGYLEDADYALRAREAGFRNVCALSIYVPHLGSRSFTTARKAVLVRRNRPALDRRFPDYEAESRAFLAADPLAPGRARLERALAGAAPIRRFVLGPARFEPAMRRRAERLASEGIGAVLGFVDPEANGLRLRLKAADFSAPQNVNVLCDTGAARAAEVEAWPHDRVEWIVAPGAPEVPRDAAGARCLACDALVAGPAPSLAGFGRVVAADALAAAWRAAEVAAPGEEPFPARGKTLAILLPYETAESQALIAALACRLWDEKRGAVLFGSTMIDERLIANGLFATGPFADSDMQRLLDTYQIGKYFMPVRDGGFWAVERFAEIMPAPVAFFDWSGVGFRRHAQDLPLDAGRPDSAILDDLLRWAFEAGAPREPRRPEQAT